jgi:hypothetical protein
MDINLGQRFTNNIIVTDVFGKCVKAGTVFTITGIDYEVRKVLFRADYRVFVITDFITLSESFTEKVAKWRGNV